jgi:beta-lactamase regulating signal transducer with metallopeptidase domain
MMFSLELLAPKLWMAGWQAALLASLIWLSLRLTGRTIPPFWRHALWLIPLVRLLLIELPPNPFLLFQWVPAPEQAIREVVVIWQQTPSALPIHTASPSVSNPEPSIVSYLFLTWALGSLVFLILLLLREEFAQRKINTLPLIQNPRIDTLLSEGTKALGLKKAPVVRLSDNGIPAGVSGLFRPTLLLSREVLKLSDASLRHVLWHELAHLRRKDLPLLYLARLACVLHWFNPAAWWTLQNLKHHCEPACDALALSRLEAGAPTAYAQTLVGLLENLPAKHTWVEAGLGESGHSLKERVKDIFSRQHLVSSIVAATVAMVLVIGGLGALPSKSRLLPASTARVGENKTNDVEIKCYLIEVSVPKDPEKWRKIESILASADLKKISELKSADMLTAPVITVAQGQRSKIRVAREFRYPSSYEWSPSAKIHVPKDFDTKDIGVTIDLKPEIQGDHILVSGKLETTQFVGFVKQPNASILSPEFNARSLAFTADLANGIPASLSPGMERQETQKIVDEVNGEKLEREVSVKKKIAVILVATLLPSAQSPPPSEVYPQSQSLAEGKVVGVNKESRFIVMNQGSELGLTEEDIRGIRRGNSQIALVQPASIEAKTSVATVLPGETASPREGDLVTYPEGLPIPGRKGEVYSPFSPTSGQIDVAAFPSGTQVKCPYTTKVFLVP